MPEPKTKRRPTTSPPTPRKRKSATASAKRKRKGASPKRKPRNRPPISERPWYLMDEVAELLVVSKWTAYQMNKRGEIPGAKRLGNGMIRVLKDIFNAAMGISPDWTPG